MPTLEGKIDGEYGKHFATMIRFSRLVVLVAFGLTLSACANISDASLAEATCSRSEEISWSEHLPVDGANLYLLIRGAHCDAPILLWLHGGPGAAERPLFRLYNGSLEQHFVVAYWDQRGAGRSFDPDADPRVLTVGRHLEDLDRVIDHLRARLNQRKLVLVGHSWGSALGLLYARAHPEKIAAVVGVAQFVSGSDSQRAQYAFINAQAHHRMDQTTLADLRALGAPPYSGGEALRMQDLVDRYGGVFHSRPSFLGATLSGLIRGYVTFGEIGTIIRANSATLDVMTPEIGQLDLRVSVPGVEVPVVFMLGRFDRQLDPALAVAYFNLLSAPLKRLIWFEQSAHNIPFEESRRFERELVSGLATILASQSGEPSSPDSAIVGK